MNTLQAKRIADARCRIVLHDPFYTPTLFGLIMEESEQVPTAATDGVRILYNPEFMGKCSADEVCGVLLHECWHVMLMHPLRKGWRDHQKWNVATDYVINNMMDNSRKQLCGNSGADLRGRLYTLPLWCKPLLDHQYDNLSGEDVYAKLPDPPPGQGGGAGGKEGNGTIFGEVLPAPGTAEAKELEKKIRGWILAGKNMVQQARGSLPFGADGIVEEIIDPKIPWHELLRQLVAEKCKDDYSWRTPNPRYAHTGFCLPSLDGESVGYIVVGNDTSGSMWSQDILATGLGVCQSILDEMNPQRMVVADIDCDIHNWREYLPGDRIPLDIKGGGGSSCIPLFNRIAEEEDKPSAVIIFTDLILDIPCNEPDFPVYWVSVTKDKSAPWGRTIHVDV